MNKKLIKFIIVCVLVSVVVGGSIAAIVVVNKENKKEKLIVYNWAEYIDPTVLEDFEEYYFEATGKEIEVVYSLFDTNETMMTEVIKDNSEIDLVCPSEYAIQKLISKGMLMPIDMSEDEYENVANIYPAIREKVAEVFPADENGISMNDYFVPYMWGTLGILYNTNYVTEDDLAEGWGLLWNTGKNPELEGKILMKDSVRDVYAATMTYLKEYEYLSDFDSKNGTDYNNLSIEELINTVDENLLEMAQKALAAQRSQLKGYEVDFGKDDMINEIAYVDLAWSGDALWAIEESDYDEETDTYQLDYFVPEIGGNVWFDGWVIPKAAQNVTAAKMFINYLCRPDIAMRNAMEIGYTCSIDPDVFMDEENEYSVEALASLEECEYEIDDYFGDTRRYPDFADPEVAKTLGVMQDFGDNNDAAVSMWEGVKAGGGEDDNSAGLLVATIFGIVGSLALIAGVCELIRYLKNRRRPHVDVQPS